MRASARVAAALFLLLGVCPAAPAAGPEKPASSADSERQADLRRLRSRIGSLEAQLAESHRRQATLSEELSRLELQLAIAAGEKELLARLREDYGARLDEIGVERKSAEKAVQRSRRALLARARLLHRFGRFGYLRILLEARDVPAFVESVALLNSLARRDARLLTEHRESQTRLEANLSREKALKAETDRLYAKSGAEERRIASLKAERENLLERQRTLSATQRREVATLSDKATRLEGLLERLSQRPEEPVGPAGGIRPWKGVLDWPARGALVETFGRHRHPKFDAWTLSNGISLALPVGTPVRAVFAGKAVYAQWLAEYGNLVILDHGDGVFTLYAWLQAVSVRSGAYVPAGSTIGLVGTGPGRDEPGLYFEVRDRQKANDPVAWLR
jgi:septal ring factor EnvC (AmiA/AmiB activator)